MKVVKWIAIVIGTLVAVFFIGAVMLPSTYKVERSVVINAPAAKIQPYFAPKEMLKWTVWLKREPTMKVVFSGPELDAGSTWSWEGKDGRGTMQYTKVVPGKLDYTLSFPDMGMTSGGAVTLTPQGEATKVSWTNEGDVGKSPVNRWFVPFLDGMIGPDYAAGLAGLKDLVEKK